MVKNQNYKKKKKEPIFSIITVVLDGEKYIEKTIKSVLGQSFKNFEYIVVDGKSKDETINIIRKYSKKITKWVSEKDKGLYDAFNKGIKMSKGKYICIVNSDDLLTKNALKTMNNYAVLNPDIDFFFGSVKKHWGVLYGYRPYKIYWSWGFYSSHSTGFFIKTESAKKVGLYNLKYKYSADYDYFFRMIVKKKLKGIGTKKDEIFGTFRRGGFSSKVDFISHFFEEIKIRIDNGQNKLLILIIKYALCK